MKLSLAGVVAAAALVKAAGFLFVAFMNVLFRPYGGTYLALLTSIYPGYDPVSGPLSILLGTLYSLIAGAVAGLLFGWLYNFLADRF
jgi:hypothetical protein